MSNWRSISEILEWLRDSLQISFHLNMAVIRAITIGDIVRAYVEDSGSAKLSVLNLDPRRPVITAS